MAMTAWLSGAVCLVTSTWLSSAEPAASARPESVPLTRDAMKAALEASKESVPRLPLPPLTAAEQTLIAEQQAQAAQSGMKPRRIGLANNGRMRAYYLPEYGFDLAKDIERARAGTNRNSESSLDQNLRTMMFWIVSRGNNCTYCLGHQESSLATRGVTDDILAGLDGDWSEFAPAERAAFTFASKLSFQPHRINDQDVQALRTHYSEEKIVELIAAIAGFNATNRWTGPLRIKQDVSFPFVRPTSVKFAARAGNYLPTTTEGQGAGAPVPRARPALEDWAAVQAALQQARERTPRLALLNDARERVLGKRLAPEVTPPEWQRLLGLLPQGGVERIKSYQAVLDQGTISPRVKAILAYVGARQDRAWYALGHAISRLKAQGISDAQIAALDQPEKIPDQADRELVEFARKVTVDPALITDDDFAAIRKLFGDKQTAEILYVTTQATFFDRLTEAAGLQLEPTAR